MFKRSRNLVDRETEDLLSRVPCDGFEEVATKVEEFVRLEAVDGLARLALDDVCPARHVAMTIVACECFTQPRVAVTVRVLKNSVLHFHSSAFDKRGPGSHRFIPR